MLLESEKSSGLMQEAFVRTDSFSSATFEGFQRVCCIHLFYLELSGSDVSNES